MNIDDALAQINARLKAGNIGVAVERKKTHLYLRAILPPRPGSAQTRAHQQRIVLNLYANEESLKQAEAEAKKLGALLACREFTWEPYMKIPIEKVSETVADWVIEFEKEYFIQRQRNDKTLTTWKGDYLKVFRQLPQTSPLSAKLIRDYVIETEPDSKTRKRTCMALSSLARFAGIEINLTPLAGRYSPKKVTPRTLPDDETIQNWFSKISNPAWRWFYGMVATYGLRPHEAFHLDLQEFGTRRFVVSVLEGKTGARRVWACYPEWIDQFNLLEVKVPAINLNRSNSAIGSSCGHYFKNQVKLPFQLYDLRHCWAVRTLEFGLDTTLAAQQMGHSVAVHNDIYHHWISDNHQQKAFEALMMRQNRPIPPPLQ